MRLLRRRRSTTFLGPGLDRARQTLQESIAAEVEVIKRFYEALPVDMSQDEKRRRLDHELNRWSVREARRDLGLSG